MMMEEFNSGSIEALDETSSKDQEHLWLCGASKTSKQADGSKWCRYVMDEAYFPTPFPEHNMEPLEWPHCLATIDVSTLNHGIKFSDEDGYDIVPICMVQVLGGHDEVLVEDVSDVDDMTIKTESELLYVASNEDTDRSKHRVEKVKMLLK